MDDEKYNASRLMICTAWITARELGCETPERVPTADDMRDHYAWCAEKWESIGRMDKDAPETNELRAMFREAGPGPLEVERYRDYSARHGELDYEQIKTWWKRVENMGQKERV